MRQVVLDTETTGLDPKLGHRVIEIGCVELIDRRLTGNHFHRYINPEREVEEEALKVHNITNEFLLDKPLFSEVKDEFFEFVKGAELIIHNAAFDIGFLNHELQRADRSFTQLTAHCTVFDTLLLARKLFPGQRNNLDALCKRYEVNNAHREWHGALLDAEILAQVYLAMTGGQVSLFGDGFAVENKVELAQSEQIVQKARAKLPIIHATAEELLAHEAFLKNLKNHLWHDE